MAKNFDQKIFMFPEHYNLLRQELYSFWNDPEKKPYWTHWKCGWAMAFSAEDFVEYMNTCLDGVFKVAVITNDDEMRIDNICKIFLDELRRRRGAQKIIAAS